MKRIALFFIILCFMLPLTGQEVEVFGLYSGSNYTKFQNNIGYGLGYNHITKSGNKLGFVFHHSFCNNHYSEIYPSSEDGISTYIMDIDAKNQRIAIKMNYTFRLIENPKSALFIGPEFSLNYYYINEQVERYENEMISAASYHSDYWKSNKTGFGLLIDFEIKKVFSENISLFAVINPELTGFEKMNIDGSYLKSIIWWYNVRLGLRYKFTKE